MILIITTRKSDLKKEIKGIPDIYLSMETFLSVIKTFRDCLSECIIKERRSKERR